MIEYSMNDIVVNGDTHFKFNLDTRYYANENRDRIIDITSVGFVTRYDEDMMSITYRDIDNTVSPEKVSVKNIDIYPDRLRMFDWYIIDENNKKEVTK